ncbi:hypothetical protein M1L65_07035 [Slackia exigua]|uniref:hypothetical protein n=1 Tax=Slackia exigua TaxID=84109 RepID=UPI003BA19700
MGLFDKAKEMAAQAAAQAQDAAMQKVVEVRDAGVQKREDAAMRRDLSSMFRASQKYGELEIDGANQLLKIRHATGDLPKKKSGLGTATAAVMTLGASVAVSAAMKPKDVIVPFSEVRGYSVIQDDDVIQGGTLGAAAVCGVLTGGFGAVAGAIGGKRKISKVVNTMALRVDLSNFDMPCAVVPYISKPTKTKDKDYLKAVSAMQQAMSCLDLVLANHRN